MAKTLPSIAVALMAIGTYAVKAGQLVEGPPALLDQLRRDGQVDPHKDAIAHARAREASTVVIPEPPTPEEAANRQAADAAVHYLETLVQVARPDDQERLQSELTAAREARAALG